MFLIVIKNEGFFAASSNKKQKMSLVFVLMFVFLNKRGIFTLLLSYLFFDYKSFDKLIDFVSNEWERRKIFFSDYHMVKPRLVSSRK